MRPIKSLLHALSVCLIVVIVNACVNNSSNPPSVGGVYVLNEGNFNKGNASITAYNPETGDVNQQAFQAKNGSNHVLGDLGQSFAHIDGRLYAVINNSDKIEVMDPQTLQSIGTISLPEGSSPRYMVKASDGIGLVTNLYKNSVYAIDLSSLTVMKEIPVGHNPEGIAVSNSKAYVANSGLGAGNSLSIIDTQTMQVVDSLNVGDNPTTVKTDASGRVWVVCTGAYNDYNDPGDDTPGKIVLLNGSDGVPLDSLEVGGHPTDLLLDDNRGIAYLLNGTVEQINMNNLSVENTSFIDRNLYAIGYTDVQDYRIYGADPKNYQQAGKAIIFNQDGAVVDSFKTGIIPGDFYFEVQD